MTAAVMEKVYVPEEFITAIYEEKRRIQKALLSVGYNANIVKFMSDTSDLPRLEIHAFPVTEGDG
jgi:hypothetical protein